jgi:predicted ATP-dependent Lon-type protease
VSDSTTAAQNLQLSPLDEKTVKVLGDRVVLKPLTRWNEAYKEFPRYVMEYLCARYVDPINPIPGQQKIDQLLKEHYVESDAKELIKSRIKERREYIYLGLCKFAWMLVRIIIGQKFQLWVITLCASR